MAEHAGKRLLVLSMLLILILVGVGLTGRAIADVTGQADQPKTLTRDLEPVIITGSQVAALLGAPVEHLFVYSYTGSGWGQIPVQVDEVTAGGSYTITEDGLLDDNDEIVFMAMDLGDQAPYTAGLAATLPISPAWYEIEVTHPLSPAQKGWAYLVRSSQLISTSVDYVDIVTSSQRITITGRQYQLGIPTAFQAIDYLTLNGSSTDILDRTKIRVVVSVSGFPFAPMTEPELENPDTVLLKDGPVRGILQQAVSSDPLPPLAEANLNTTNLAYASMLQSTADISFTLPEFVDIMRVRTSADLNSAASGATFYNANSTEPVTVTIDGVTDTVDATPFSNWTQISTTTGRLIQVSDPASAGGTRQNYYCDSNPASLECDGTAETGDDMSYGDSGILIEGSINPSFTLESWLFILPPPGDGQDNVGNMYQGYYFNPLNVATYLRGVRVTMYLPVIYKNSP